MASCAGAQQLDVAWDGSRLLFGCLTSAGVLTVRSTSLDGAGITGWQNETLGFPNTGLTGFDLVARAGQVALLVDDGAEHRAYDSLGGQAPLFSFDGSGEASIALTSSGVSVLHCDQTAGSAQMASIPR